MAVAVGGMPGPIRRLFPPREQALAPGYKIPGDLAESLQGMDLGIGSWQYQ